MFSSTSGQKSYLFLLPWSLDSLGGVNQVVENLFWQMKKDFKYIPIIMVNSWDDTKIRKDNIKGIDHYYFRLRSPWNSTKKVYNFLLYCFESIRTSWRLYKFIKINDIVVINVHYCSLYALNIVFLKFLRIFKGCFVLSFHGKDLLNAKQSRWMENTLWKLMLRSSDMIVTCSESLKKEIHELDESCCDKVVVIHNGIDSSLFPDNIDSHCDLSLGENKYILNVATLEHKKGQDVLVKAFRELSDDFPDVSLVIIGRPGGAEHQVKESIESSGLCNRVRLYEGLPHDQVLAFMEKATIFVLPSRYEPFGIVILEAGIYGIPVVASNVGGVSEILSHNKTGKLFEPGDYLALAKELRCLLKGPELRNRLGRNLQVQVKRKFSWERTYHKYINCIASR